MTTRAFASVLAALLAAPLAAGPLAAQTTTALTPAAQRSSADGHLLEIRDGAVHLDGVALPDAVPPGLNLAGMTLALEYAGPITPVVEVDGQAYVLERRRLVRFEESGRAGERVYVLGEARSESDLDASAMDDDRLAQMSQEVYMRELADRDRALYARMQHESTLEAGVESLATRVRRTDAGPERVRLRGELRTRLSELFTLKQQIRREEVERAQTELGAMRALLDVRDAQHEAIVDGRLRGLVGE